MKIDMRRNALRLLRPTFTGLGRELTIVTSKIVPFPELEVLTPYINSSRLSYYIKALRVIAST